MLINFLLACLNFFTIPAWFVLWLVCKIFKAKTPGIKRYKTVFYPSWSEERETGNVKKETPNKKPPKPKDDGITEDDLIFWDMIDDD